MHNNEFDLSNKIEKLGQQTAQTQQMSVSTQKIPKPDTTLSTGSKGGHQPGDTKIARKNSQISETGSETGSINTSTQKPKNTGFNQQDIPKLNDSLSNGSKAGNQPESSENDTIESNESLDLFNTQIDLTEVENSPPPIKNNSTYGRVTSFFQSKSSNEIPQKHKGGLFNPFMPK